MFKQYLEKQITLHPSMRPQDVIKLCFQAAFGAEHLLGDMARVKDFFDAEFLQVDERDGLVVERIADDVCRINLAVWKKRGFCKELLFDLFVQSAQVQMNGGEARFWDYVSQAEGMPFSDEEWQGFVAEYKRGGVRAVHHSEIYREREKPAYRVVSGEYIERIICIVENKGEMLK